MTDLGAIGVIVPTVDDALEARDAARFSRYPPVRAAQLGWRVVQSGMARGQLPRDRQRQHARHRHDRNARRVANAEEIAATHGVDVVLIGNNDLELLRLVAERSAYQDALIKVHDAALKYGKCSATRARSA